jgi:hypothetical protein
MPAMARMLLRGVAALLAVALLVQFFIAGMAALTNPEWWAYHLKWVAFFQWLVVPLPALAWLGGPPRPLRVTLACIPFVQMALQYLLAHRAMDGRWPIGLGLHAVDAALMLIVVVALASACSGDVDAGSPTRTCAK